MYIYISIGYCASIILHLLLILSWTLAIAYRLPIDCLDAHMLSHSGYGPGPWAPKGRGPYPLCVSIWASRAINRQSISKGKGSRRDQ